MKQIHGSFLIEHGLHSYEMAKNLFGRELVVLRRKLDASFSQLQVAQDVWASDLFI